MRTRVISSLVGLVILGAVMALINTWVLNAVMALISVIALFEILRATNCLKNKWLVALSFVMSILIPFGRMYFIRFFTAQIIFAFFLLFFIVIILNSQTVRVEQASMVFMFSVFIPLFFSCAVFLRDLYGAVAGGFYLFLALGCAWLCDTGAYFTGRKFGRHKLAPVVSPNKTIEGAIGGLLSCTVVLLVIAVGFSLAMQGIGVKVLVNYAALAAAVPVCGVSGMLGDLSASVIKRQFNVKDYGNIMPGHGGIMDRFDSVMFTLPTMFVISLNIQLISAI